MARGYRKHCARIRKGRRVAHNMIFPKCPICRKPMKMIEASPDASCFICGHNFLSFHNYYHCECGSWAHYPRCPTEKKIAILDDFIGITCSGCGARKKSTQSFYFSCYRKLPQNLARNLWRRFGLGYEEAFETAKKWLHEHTA